MIYLDNGATSYHKPPQVLRAVGKAMISCASPGRGGYPMAMEAARQVHSCRELAGRLFSCSPEQVVFTSNCTHGLNIAIRSLVKPGDRVVISGFEHNAVVRPLKALSAEIVIAGRLLFDWDGLLDEFEAALKSGVSAAIFTHVSNVFGYILPIEEMAQLCRRYGVPFIVDAAQSAGAVPISMGKLGANFIAMPGHKGLLGPQGTGILLCDSDPEPLLFGGTGSDSKSEKMPAWLPDRLEAGTLNVPGICGLAEGIRYILQTDPGNIGTREHRQVNLCAEAFREMGIRIFYGKHQSGTFSFLLDEDCEETAQKLSDAGIAVRAGLHCAPFAHASAGTLETGTVRVSFGYDANDYQSQKLIYAVSKLRR